MQPQQVIKKPLSNGDARGAAPSFEDIKRQYAQASLERRFLPPNDPRRFELEAFMRSVQQEAQMYLEPEELAQTITEVQELERNLYEQQRTAAGERNKQAAMAQALRNREMVARQATLGEFGEAGGLDFANYEKLTEGAKTVKLKTGRAHVDGEKMQAWADEIAPHLKAKKGASWKQVVNILDNWADMRDARPVEFDKAIRERELDPVFMRQTLKNWRNESIALGLAEKLAKQDDENKVPHETDIELTDRHHRRGTLIKHTTEAFAEAAASGDPDAAESFVDSVSPEFRDEAVRDTLRLRKQGEGDEVGMRDAIIRAFDDYEEEEPNG